MTAKQPKPMKPWKGWCVVEPTGLVAWMEVKTRKELLGPMLPSFRIARVVVTEIEP